MDHTRRFGVRLFHFCTTGLAAATLAGACDTEGPPNRSARLGAIIEAGGTVTPFIDSHTTSAQTSFDESVNGQVLHCNRATHDVVAGFGAFPVFTLDDALAFPGNLLQGATIDWPSPLAIPVARAGGTVTLTMADGAPGITLTLPHLSRDWVAQSAKDIVAKASRAHAARTTWSTSRVSAREELGLALHTPIEHLAPEVRAAFVYKSDVAYRRVLVTLTQAYYTIDFELPADPAALFTPEVTPEELARQVGPDNPATFVSSVTYGRVTYLLVQSTAPYEDIEAAIDASLDAALSGEVPPEDVMPIDALDDVRIGGFALGDDGAGAYDAAKAGTDGLAQVVAKGARLSAGTPVSYVVRNLAHPDVVVRAKVVARFDATECEAQ